MNTMLQIFHSNYFFLKHMYKCTFLAILITSLSICCLKSEEYIRQSGLRTGSTNYCGYRNHKHNLSVNVLHLHSTFWSKTLLAHKQLVHRISCEKIFYLQVYILKLVDEFLKISQKALSLLKEILGCCSIERHGSFPNSFCLKWGHGCKLTIYYSNTIQKLRKWGKEILVDKGNQW